MKEMIGAQPFVYLSACSCLLTGQAELKTVSIPSAPRDWENDKGKTKASTMDPSDVGDFSLWALSLQSTYSSPSTITSNFSADGPRRRRPKLHDLHPVKAETAESVSAAIVPDTAITVSPHDVRPGERPLCPAMKLKSLERGIMK